MFTGKYRLQGVESPFFYTEPDRALAPGSPRVGSLEKVLTAFPRALVKEEREGEVEVTRFITQLMFLFRTSSSAQEDFMLELLAILETFFLEQMYLETYVRITTKVFEVGLG